MYYSPLFCSDMRQILMYNNKSTMPFKMSHKHMRHLWNCALVRMICWWNYHFYTVMKLFVHKICENFYLHHLIYLTSVAIIDIQDQISITLLKVLNWNIYFKTWKKDLTNIIEVRLVQGSHAFCPQKIRIRVSNKVRQDIPIGIFKPYKNNNTMTQVSFFWIWM